MGIVHYIVTTKFSSSNPNVHHIANLFRLGSFSYPRSWK